MTPLYGLPLFDQQKAVNGWHVYSCQTEGHSYLPFLRISVPISGFQGNIHLPIMNIFSSLKTKIIKHLLREWNEWVVQICWSALVSFMRRFLHLPKTQILFCKIGIKAAPTSASAVGWNESSWEAHSIVQAPVSVIRDRETFLGWLLTAVTPT